VFRLSLETKFKSARDVRVVIKKNWHIKLAVSFSVPTHPLPRPYPLFLYLDRVPSSNALGKGTTATHNSF